MKFAKAIVFSALACIALMMARADDKEVVKKDMEQLQGEWSMLMPDGKPIPDSKRVCKEDETTVTFGGWLMMKARFTIDPSKKPKTIDYQIIDGEGKGKRRLGIYELDGDTVKFFFGAPDAERPKDFSSKLGEGQSVSVWKRNKK